MALSEIDRNLIERCLSRKPRSWEDFVDRFLGLVIHVITHTARARSMRLVEQDYEDLAAEVFLTIVSDDFAVIRKFRGQSSLATYLTVVARRVVVRELLKRKNTANLDAAESADPGPGPEERITNREQVESLLARLEGKEAAVVRLYHLEAKSYQEISEALEMPENSIGPTLSRAREKMRQAE